MPGTEETIYDDFDLNDSTSQNIAEPALNGPLKLSTPLVPSTGFRNLKTRAGLTTSSGADGSRPLTSVAGAGFQGSTTRLGSSSLFDQTGGGVTVSVKKTELSPLEQSKEIENKVFTLINSSVDAVVKGDLVLSLERAKEAVRKEKLLHKFLESNNIPASSSNELTYAVTFNLANCYHKNKMYQEAIATYNSLIKNKNYPNAGRLRVNVGNVHFDMKEYAQAIRMYRMALDSVPTSQRILRSNMLLNVGIACFKVGRFQDAVSAFDSSLESFPTFRAAFNLLVCYVPLGNTELMRSAFLRLIEIPLPQDTMSLQEYEQEQEDDTAHGATMRDPLREDIQAERRTAIRLISRGARLLARHLEEAPGTGTGHTGFGFSGSAAQLHNSAEKSSHNWRAGYEWTAQRLSEIEGLEVAAAEIRMASTLALLRPEHRNFAKALEELRKFDISDPAIHACASLNLSFLQFLDGSLSQAMVLAESSVHFQRYNAFALVNLGVCYAECAGDMIHAREAFLEAIGVEADCAEAIFNLGCINRMSGELQEALQIFQKLLTIVPNAPEVLYHIACINKQLGRNEESLRVFKHLSTLVPGDSGVLLSIGQLHLELGDPNAALETFNAAHTRNPADTEVISWLGVWAVKNGLFERAASLFQEAAILEPNNPKWLLMLAGAYRRSQKLSLAYGVYERVLSNDPDNFEALRYITVVSNELGINCETYMRRLEVVAKQQQQLKNSANANTTVTTGHNGQTTENLPNNMLLSHGSVPGSEGGRNQRDDIRSAHNDEEVVLINDSQRYQSHSNIHRDSVNPENNEQGRDRKLIHDATATHNDHDIQDSRISMLEKNVPNYSAPNQHSNVHQSTHIRKGPSGAIPSPKQREKDRSQYKQSLAPTAFAAPTGIGSMTGYRHESQNVQQVENDDDFDDADINDLLN